MRDITHAAAAFLVLTCILGGTGCLLIGSLRLVMGGDWTLAAGGAGLIGAGLLIGKFWAGENDDETVKNQGD